ncbi:hypothetical protein ACJJI4_18770 [Microbulbifer sp. TRSA002]|uniref:hypothetical protein n=1 Tax=Microbulbifer sp. TRSA002 TaxID=3243382 RepID=UPI00403A6271
MSKLILFILLVLSFNVFAEEYTSKYFFNLIKDGNIEEIDSVLSEEIELESIYENSSMSLLEQAVFLQKVEIVSFLLSKHKPIVETYINKAIKRACATNNQNTKIIDLLISNGGDINAVDERETNCLYRSVIAADLDFYSYLLSKGADPNMKIDSFEAEYLGFPLDISIKEAVNIRFNRYREMMNLTK